MEDLLKKFLYTGVGLIAMTSEKIQDTVDDLVSQRKISEEEGKKIVKDFMKDTESKTTEMEGKFKDIFENVASKLDFLKKDSNIIEDLQDRIAELEDELKEATTAAKKKTTARKTTRSKKTTV